MALNDIITNVLTRSLTKTLHLRPQYEEKIRFKVLSNQFSKSVVSIPSAVTKHIRETPWGRVPDTATKSGILGMFPP